MTSTNTIAHRLSNNSRLWIVVGITFFLASVLSEVATTLQRRKRGSVLAAADATRGDDAGTAAVIKNNNINNNNGLFTSMEGEFEWNQLMVPRDASRGFSSTGGSSSSSSLSLSVPAKDRETGRRLVLDHRVGNLRGWHRRGA